MKFPKALVHVLALPVIYGVIALLTLATSPFLLIAYMLYEHKEEKN